MTLGKPATPILLLLALAACLGVVYGIIEGLESALLSLVPQGLSWQNGNSVDAMLYMPPFYLIAYLAIGLVCAGLARLIRRDWWDILLVFGLTALSGYLAAKNQGAIFAAWSSAILGLGIGAVATRVYRKHRERVSHRVYRWLPVLVVIALAIIGGTYLLNRVVESRRLARLPPPAGNPPNVLLIVLDTERADHLSSYGYRRPTTPHLDSLAAQGVLFEQAFAASSWTLPSHASLFTGRIVSEHRAGAGNRRVLGTEYPTLAERLSRAGYATGGFVANTFWAARQTGLDRGFVHYEDFYGTVGDAIQRMTLVREFPRMQEWLGLVDIRGRKRAPRINQQFLDWVERVQERPFFAFLNYMDVHAPYLPPSSHEGRFGPIRPEFRPRRLEVGNQPKSLPSPERLVYRVDRYDESLLYLDEHIGKLLAELEHRGLLAHTIVIVTSDHGEHFGEHGIIEHGASLYTQETRVPLIIRYPPRVPRRTRVRFPVSTTNLAATITALIGVRDAGFPGHTLMMPAEGGTAAVPAVSEMAKAGGTNWPASKGWVKSLVLDQWHFILRETGETELFDLTTDPDETRNLAGTPPGAAILTDLRCRLETIVKLGPC